MRKITFVLLSLLLLYPVVSQQSYSLSKFAATSTSSTSTSSTSTSSLTEYETFLESINPQLAMSTKDYIVTSGDIYTLAFAAGSTPVQYIIPVDTSYKIRIANLAVIDASNKTFSELKNQVESLIQKNYPMSGVQFALTSAAVFKVNIMGEVLMSDEVQLWALTRLSNVVDKYLTDFSSIRDVTIKSSNGNTKIYDLFKAIRYGDLTQNPYLRPDDTIIINRAVKKIKVSGQVERPNTYQLLKDENLYELINNYSSGLTIQADTSRIEIIKNSDVQDVKGEKVYITKQQIQDNYKLNNFDEVYIPSLEESELKIIIEGAIVDTTQSTVITNESENADTQITNRVSISYKKGSTYNSIIHENSKLFSSISDIDNSYIIRNNTIIPLNIRGILYDEKYTETLQLENMDTVIIPAKQYFITVIGAVTTPGRYEYVPDRTYDYYVGLAGGFDKDKNIFDNVKIVDSKGNKYSKKDFIKPEMTITATSNSVKYYISEVSTYVVTILTILSSCLSLYAIFKE